MKKTNHSKTALSALLLLASALAHATSAGSVDALWQWQSAAAPATEFTLGCQRFPECEPPVAPEPPAERSKGKKQG